MASTERSLTMSSSFLNLMPAGGKGSPLDRFGTTRRVRPRYARAKSSLRKGSYKEPRI
jgi:hypothetical protein